MNQTKTRMLTEGAIMVALAFILSFLKIVNFPWGGSITILSMLPIVVFSLRYGAKYGFAVSFVYSVLQLVQGIVVDGIFAWGLTPMTLIAVIFLDYLLPFTLLGAAGFFNNGKFTTVIAGTVVSVMFRFVCHYLSGVFIWKTVGELLGISTTSPYLYSLLYNGAYMIPEMIFTAIGAVILFKTPQMRKLLGLSEN
ncbi:MAG: energy-coupled thiamine transporter ThiT [Clostridia bacterium]|nr:energy-coupled thiamine transporter ThiT [Clostridia bacterium]